ncbi:MAG: hypothetical protein ISS31_10270 [Kiritimatiellae bacterium]|nr:hypothetical protein [Kiritimatiellia bacterium]
MMPKGLRWLLFVVGVGTLVGSGIYLGTSIGESGDGWRFLRAGMFLLLGLFFVLRYGESTSGSNAESREAPRSGAGG